MNYQLAKQLKDAEFPQPTDDYGGQYVNEKGEWTGYMNDGAVYVPTLSELIDVLGERFNKLQRWSATHWVATPINENRLVGDEVVGQTPEEAVANLWLELIKS